MFSMKINEKPKQIFEMEHTKMTTVQISNFLYNPPHILFAISHRTPG